MPANLLGKTTKIPTEQPGEMLGIDREKSK